jgi:Zinc knuckle
MNQQQAAAAIATLQQQLAALATQRDADRVDLTDARQRLGQAQARIQQLEAQAPAPGGGAVPHASRHLPTLTFEGKDTDDWLSFRDSFLNTARFQGYSDQQAKRALKACMRGVANLTTSQVDHEVNGQTIDQLLDVYEEMFLPPSASDMARTKFEAADQMPKESILQYHGRLRVLYARAYPDLHANQDPLLRRFAQGLRRLRVREHVLRSRPANYGAALQAAQAEQAIMDATAYLTSHPTGGAAGGPEPMELGAVPGRPPGKCHTCQKPGHFAKDCRSSKARAGSSSSSGKGAGGARPSKPALNTGGTWKDKDKRLKYRRFLAQLEGVLDDESDDPEDEEEAEEVEEEEDRPPEPQQDF